jgi:hypothetical protein
MTGHAPILITGSHRSGSTWVGKMLALSPQVGYVHEPFNPELKASVCKQVPEYWFQYYDGRTGEEFGAALEQALRYKYPFFRNIRAVNSAREAARVVREQLRFCNYRLTNAIPLVKDPIALCSTEWLSQYFEMRVLVTIRHPAAFCSSLKLKGWSFDFKNFLNQPMLIEKYMMPYADSIREFSVNNKSVIEQSALLWNIFHYLIKQYKESHSDWIFCRHEDLSLNPVQSFKDVYGRLGLEFSPDIEEKIVISTGAHNPVEQEFRKNLTRDSRKNIYNWKKRLSDDEIRFIRDSTNEVSCSFYDQHDW